MAHVENPGTLTSFPLLLRDGLVHQCGVHPGDLLVLGVSGGADSSALLLGLAGLRDELGIRLDVLHVNHGLRGAEAEEDARFVLDLAARLGVPGAAVAADVPILARARRVGIEAAARAARYRALGDRAEAVGAAAVAVAHTADDQLETQLMHWLRGAGLGGLVGMRPIVELDPSGPDGEGGRVRVIRPMLRIRRAEALAYCRARGIEPRVDPSNADPRYTRNRIRHELIPLLESFNPRVADAVARLGATAADTLEFLRAELDRRWPDLAVTRAESEGRVFLVSCRRRAYRELPRALQREALLRLAVAFEARRPELSAGDVERALDAIVSTKSGQVVELGGGLLVRVQHDRVDLVESSHVTAERIEPTAIPLAGTVTLVGSSWLVETALRSAPCRPDGNAFHADFDLAALGLDRGVDDLVARARRPGDRVRLPGGQLKKIQDVLVDRHVPREERDGVPILVAPVGTVWVVPHLVDRRCVAGPSSTRVVCVRLRRATERATRQASRTDG